MKKLILLALFAQVMAAQTLTTTLTGTIKDLAGNTVTSGRILFTSSLKSGQDSTIPGTARFVPSTVTCLINASGNPVASPGGTAPCVITKNTALSPAGTSYVVNIQPYNVSPGAIFNFYAIADTVDISTIAPTPSQLPTNYAGIQGPPGCVVGSTCTADLTPRSVGGVLYAEQFSGSDIGDKINHAYEMCGGTAVIPIDSCIVNVAPGKFYPYATTIHMPNVLSHGYIRAPQLQLNGSSLGYTGTTDAVIVHGENANSPASTGGIYNGVIAGTSNLTGMNMIHSLGRLGFVLDGLNIAGGENCILLENTNTDGGPGYHEENTYTNFQTGSCHHHVNSIIGTGGTNSFEYNFFDNWHLQMAGQNVVEECGICALSGEDWQGLYMNAKVNTSSPVTPRISLIRSIGSFMARGTVVLHGENTGGATTTFGLYASGGGVIHYDGSASITGFTPYGDDGGNTTTAVLNNYTYHASESVFEFGFKARQCAYIYDYQSPKHWFAQNSGEQADCSEQWLTRVTSGSDPKVNLPVAGGAVPTNSLFMQSSGKNGFGPGYGLVDDSTGSHRSPTHSLEATDFGVSSLSTGSTIVSADFLAPNMPTGGDTCIDLGKLSTSTNSFLVCFRNTGTNSTDNRLFFTPIGSFTPVMIDALGNIYLPTIKSTTGARFVCVDTTGKLISQATACVGT